MCREGEPSGRRGVEGVRLAEAVEERRGPYARSVEAVGVPGKQFQRRSGSLEGKTGAASGGAAWGEEGAPARDK